MKNPPPPRGHSRSVPFRNVGQFMQPMIQKGFLGKGTYGTVEKYETSDKRNVAVKTLPSMPCAKFSPDFLREIYVMSRLHHPNVAPLIDLAFVPQNAHSSFVPKMVLPLEEGSLADFFSKMHTLSFAQLITLLLQFFCGLTYLHSVNFVHLDIKPENTLVSGWPQHIETKLADFGFVNWIQVLVPRHPNSLISGWYRPPEYFCVPSNARSENSNALPSKKADMFSAGVMLLRILAAWGLDEFVVPSWVTNNPIQSSQQFFQIVSHEPNETWSQVGCLPLYNPLKDVRTVSQGKKEEAQDKQNLVFWLNKIFTSYSIYPDEKKENPRTNHLSEKEKKKRASFPAFQKLLLLGYELLSFDPKKRPSARKVQDRLEQIAKQYAPDISFACVKGSIPPELTILNEPPQKQKEQPYNLNWITDLKIRQGLKEIYNQAYTFFREFVQSKEKKEELIRDLNHLVLATKSIYEQVRYQYSFLSEKQIPSIFVWLLSWLISGEHVKSQKEFCVLGTMIAKLRDPRSSSLRTFLEDLQDLARAFVHPPSKFSQGMQGVQSRRYVKSPKKSVGFWEQLAIHLRKFLNEHIE